MKANELMIGDWVYLNYWDGKYPQQIYGSNYNSWRGEGYADWVDTEIDDEASIKNIEPIPLTAEILEKNGFSSKTFLSSEWGCEVYFREFPSCVVEPEDAGYTFGTISYWGKQANDGSPEDWGTMYESRIKDLYYVHELQHALRLCGLDDLAENFKV